MPQLSTWIIQKFKSVPRAGLSSHVDEDSNEDDDQGGDPNKNILQRCSILIFPFRIFIFFLCRNQRPKMIKWLTVGFLKYFGSLEYILLYF